MKAIKFLLPVIFAVFLFGNQSCGKYEEGPLFSLRSKKSRVVNEWIVKKIYRNGEEQNMDLTLWYDFNADETGRYVVIFTANGTEHSVERQFEWEFDDDKTKIKIDYDDDDNIEDEEAIILKLYENEFWFKETEDNGDEWEYHLEPR